MPNPSIGAHPRPTAIDAAAAVAFGAILVLVLVTFSNYGLTWDEYAQAYYGDLLYAYYASGFEDRSVFSFSNLYYYGGAFDLAAALFNRLTPFEVYESRRLLGALIGVAGMGLVWRSAHKLGGDLAGFAALALLATCPLYYGHMYINAKDLPFAVAMAFLLYTLICAFEQHPRPGAATIVLFGLALGLTIGTRVIGGMTLAFAAAGAGVLFAVEARALGARRAAARLAALVGRLALALPLAYLVMALVWPWAVQAPLNPLRAVAYFSSFWLPPWEDLFDGQEISIVNMPWTYVPKLLLYKLPEIFTAFALVGLMGGTWLALRGTLPAWRRAALMLLVSAAVVPVVLAMAMRGPANYNSIRHFLFIVPPLAILGGLAAAVGFKRIAARSRAVAATATALAAALVGLTLADLVRVHPYQYLLFNRLAGGVPGASERYMLDYWGLSLNEASERMLARIDDLRIVAPPDRRLKVAVCGPTYVVAYALGPGFEVSNEADGADFALLLNTHYCANLDVPILAAAERFGVAFARAYDLRGHDVVSIYRQPEDPSSAQR